MTNKHSAKTLAALMADLAYGLSYAEIAKRYFGATGPVEVLRFARQYGLARVGADAPWAPLLKQWWAEGVSLEQMAERWMIDPLSVRRRALSIGLQLRDMDYSSGRKPVSKETFIKNWHAGMSVAEMVKQYGMTREKILERRREYGLAFRPLDSKKGSRWTPEEDVVIRHFITQNAKHKQIALALPGRSQASVGARAKVLGLTAKKGAKPRRTHDKAELVALKIKECLGRHGPTPLWRLRDYTGVRDQRIIQQAIMRLRRRNEIAQHRHGEWKLAP